MEEQNYYKIGQTKAISIDFTYLYPRTGTFVNVNMLLEFSLLGQVIPTRFDILPYRLSPFNSYSNADSQFIVDAIKAVLCLYNFWAIMVDLMK